MWGSESASSEYGVGSVESDDGDLTSFLKGTSKPIRTMLVVQEPVRTIQEIRIDQTPTQPQWNLIPLYKTAANGSLLFWQIGFDGQQLQIRSGYNDGVLRTDLVEVTTQNSIEGSSLESEQGSIAYRQARERYRLKYREGYQPAGQMVPVLIVGMKSYDYTPNSIKQWPVYTQPKLHGIRMLCQDDRGLSRWDRTKPITPKQDGLAIGIGLGLNMRSWLNNPFGHLQHIEAELVPFFEYLPRYATLDGELYNHEMRFTTIKSAVKTVTSVHPKLLDLEYWIFDIDYQDPEGAPYEKRYELLVNAFHRYLQDRSPTNDPNDVQVLPRSFRIVPVQLARSHAEVLHQHQQHVQNKFEGIMVKKISNGAAADTKLYRETLYTPKKCNHILKYKQFQDEEALVIQVQDSIPIVQDQRGHRYSILMRGTPEEKQSWLCDPTLLLGKEVTIRYQSLDESGIPIYPIGIAIRNYE